jgi:hypothetical protein
MSDSVRTQLRGPDRPEEVLEMGDHDLQKGKDESIEVSYSILMIDKHGLQNPSDIFQNIATLVNVQLAAEASESLPFVPFSNYNIAKYSDKLFLYGPSGCGKSRAMFELLRENLADFKKIYFINPRNPIGNESGRIKLLDLIGRLGEDDELVWDNFPDDMVTTDLDNARNVLEMIGSRNVKRFLVALKPRYLEIYRDLVHNGIPEFHTCEVSFDKEQIKKIIKTYGMEIAQFRQIYQNYIEKNVEKIARILWEIEPAPLTILDYYRELTNKIQQIQETGTQQNELSIDPLLEAKKLLRSSHYYEHQFALISSIGERKPDAEFLYTLKLCYEAGLNRKISFVEQLQKKIFNSIPHGEPLRKLGTWIYLSGQYYAMHDVSGEAIRFNDYERLKIMNYLTNDFLQVVPKSDSQVYSFGTFFGKNIEYMPREESHTFLPDSIYNYMKGKRYFEVGIGQGTGESILSLNEELKGEVLRRAETDIEFARGLAESLGRSFPSVDESGQRQIFEMIDSGDPFARFFGGSLGAVLDHLSEESQNRIFELIEKDGTFADGLGNGLGYVFTSLEKNFQMEILKKSEKNSELTRGLGMGFGRSFSSLRKAIQEELFTKGETNHEFAMGLGMGFGTDFPYLQENLRIRAFDKADNNNEFAYGLGPYIAFFFPSLPLELQTDIFEKVEKNFMFARGIGLGFGYGFPYLPKDFQKQLFAKASKNVNLADGIGQGLGFVFKHLSQQTKKQVYHLCNTNIGLAQGLGFGVGFCFKYLDKVLKEEVFQRTEEDSAFAYGLAYGLGKTFRFRPAELQNELFLRIEKNQELAKGLGAGLAFTFIYQREELQNLTFLKAKNNPQFAVGLGMGFGRTFKYLRSGIKENVYEKMEQDPQFALGLGIYVGQVFTYLTNELQKDVLQLVNKNSEFAEGLGYGLGNVFSIQTNEFQKEIFERAKENSHFSRGLATGLGVGFQFLDRDSQLKLFAHARENVEFAIGLGEGFGHIFVYLNKDLKEKILEDLGRDDDYHRGGSSNNNQINISGNGFSRGLGIGLGKNFVYVRNSFEFRIFAQALVNTQFAIGLGEGSGYVFSYLDNELQTMILRKSSENSGLARGLRIGLGHIFYYLNNYEELQNRIFREMDTNKVLAESIGECIGYNFSQLKDHNLIQKILIKAEEKSEFARGVCLEERFDDNIKYLNNLTQGQLIDIRKHVYEKYGYNKNKFSFNDYPQVGFPSNMFYSYTNEGDNEENVIEDDMKEYLQMVLDEMKNKNKNN